MNGEGGASRADYTNSTDDNVLVTGISGTEGASGYFGYAYYAENSDKLKVVAVDGGEGCIIPSDETVSNGSYVLARPLYIYVSTESLAREAAGARVRALLPQRRGDHAGHGRWLHGHPV